ncbi:TfuA-like protein [Lysinibacillus xylanilyticus]|uniref:TfuA-like core domain-containing protein n=1 Tax=Lysinibacillus xylanilyticus TaxID=582475 RepID=A0A2M9Q5R3_9BACI|nr:TfuA-like protein [Lysinibacillus xylanilyticus]PJO43417.1 hypothetical protein CWD94_12775 [Lysinibacillus xylanilyticus]
MKIIVYAGPSIQKQEIVSILPDAKVLPPIKRGSLLVQDLNIGDIVIIIDGYFQQTASIQHMEILDCLQKGVTIIGCSSMGALRAAELTDYGVIGIGIIYQVYRHGLITGDDEVGILHETQKYEAFSDALIDIRLNLKKALDMNIIDNSIYDELIRLLKNQWFGNRSYSFIFHWLGEQYGKQSRERLETFLINYRVNFKYEDAVEALKLVERITRPKKLDFKNETGFLNGLKNEYSFIRNSKIREVDIINYCRLFENNFPSIYKKASMMGILTFLNSDYRKYTYEVINKLTSTNIYIKWLKKNNLTIEEVTPFLALDIFIKREKNGCLLSTVINELQDHEYIDSDISEDNINSYLSPLRIYPGIHWLRPLIVHLKMRGIYEKSYELLVEEEQNNEYSFTKTLSDKDIVDYYSRVWKVSESSFPMALKERLFFDKSEFLNVVKNPIFYKRLVEFYEFKE